jgi:hypothetical protein
VAARRQQGADRSRPLVVDADLGLGLADDRQRDLDRDRGEPVPPAEHDPTAPGRHLAVAVLLQDVPGGGLDVAVQ